MTKTGVYSDEKFRNLFAALQDFEKKKVEITVSDLASASGHKVSSMRTYIGKKLKGFVLIPKSKGRYIVKGAVDIKETDFLRHMSQRSPALDSSSQGLPHRLLNRSLDAYFLAIELYNRPIQPNRVEVFCIIIINAWELLLKAKVVINHGESEIYYKDDLSRSISIREAIKKIFPNERDAVRKNVEYLVELRDKSVHLLIPELQNQVSRIFQANVFNYLHQYRAITGTDLSSQLGTGLISLVIDRNDLSEQILKDAYDVKTTEEISRFLEKFQREEANLSSAEFAIPIEYKLTLTKNPQEGDIALSKGESGINGRLIEVPKDIDRTHPYRQVDAVQRIKDLIAGRGLTSFNSHDFQAIVFKENIKRQKSSPYYYFIEKPQTHRYSEKFIDHIIDRISNDPSYITRCRESYKHHIKNQKKVD